MKRNLLSFGLAVAMTILAGFQGLFAQTVYTFTAAGATGEIGPTQSQLNTAYASTTLAGMVTSSSNTA